MTYRRTLHIEAPVEKVFGFFTDPGNLRAADPAGVTFTDVHLTEEGLGTFYRWSASVAGCTFEGFDVFTEFVPGHRITDTSSSALEGTWTFTVEPDGTGTLLTVENRIRSFWRFPPLAAALDRLTARTHDPRFERLKQVLEQTG